MLQRLRTKSFTLVPPIPLDPSVLNQRFFCKTFFEAPTLGKTSKKPGLFSDIDHISFNTHPPPPKDDIWQQAQLGAPHSEIQVELDAKCQILNLT